MDLKSAILLLVVILCLSSKVDAQVRVTAIWKDGQSITTTNDVVCRHENWQEEGIYVDMILKPFDQLSSPSGLVYIEVTAPKGSVLKFWDKFAVMLLPPREQDTLINVFSGNGEIQSSAGGMMISGAVGITIIKTEYSVRVRHTETGSVREFLTFEGKVEIDAPTILPVDVGRIGTRRILGLVEKKTIGAGEKMAVTNDSLETTTPARISAEEVVQSASVYARIDTAKAANRHKINQDDTYQILLQRYTSVFQDPQNVSKRLELAIDQVNLDVNHDALYQLKKAEQFTPPTEKATRAVIAVAKGAAFSQAGNPAAAQREMQKARTLDPAVLEERNLRLYRFNEKARQGIIQFKFIALEPGQDPVTRRAWAVPSKLDSVQQELFKLIGQRRFAQAQKLGATSTLRRTTSIDAYANAIIYYELKDLSKANQAAAYSLKLSTSDKLLPKEARDAAQSILQLTRRQ